MDDEADTRIPYALGFVVHHLFPRVLFGNPKIAAFLASIGITLDAKSNKIALPQSAEHAALLQSNPVLKAILSLAGWGVNVHSDFHENYTDFLRQALLDIINNSDPNQTGERKALAVYDLLDFAKRVSAGEFPNLTISGGGASSVADLDVAWNRAAMPTGPNALTDEQVRAKLNEFRVNFNPATTDKGVKTNYDERYNRVVSLLDVVKGILPADELAAIIRAIKQAGTELGRNSEQGALSLRRLSRY